MDRLQKSLKCIGWGIVKTRTSRVHGKTAGSNATKSHLCEKLGRLFAKNANRQCLHEILRRLLNAVDVVGR